jgi:RNA polymerase sigma factor (sigma-70 family)
MDYSQTTTGQLIALAHDDEHAWRTFCERARPVLQALGRRLGLSPDDADDVAQEALHDCWQEVRSDRYRRERGRLRQFLVAIARHRVADLQRKQERDRGRRGDSVIAELPASADDVERIFEQEQRRKILADAMEMLANRSGYTELTLRAFERVCLDGASPDDVARELSVHPQVVYNATSRCRRRLQQLANELAELHELS